MSRAFRLGEGAVRAPVVGERTRKLLFEIAVEPPTFALRGTGEVDEPMVNLVVTRPGRRRQPEPGSHSAHLVEAETHAEQAAVVGEHQEVCGTCLEA